MEETMLRSPLRIFLPLLFGFITMPANAADEHAGHPVLGTVHFPVTCTPEAQQAFDQAIKLQHSFWYQAAHDAFSDVLQRDPECAMAYWGIAMTLLTNPFSPPPAENLADGWAALEQGRQLGAKSAREADYIAALSEFYRDADTKDHRTRVLAYEQAMAQLHARYPDDSEAAIYYALALNVAALPTDKTYAKQLEAAEILETEVVRQPDHPGVVHYLIHTYDYPPLAERGLKAADRYAELAASAPHALHMPSHIYTRLGHWDRSIETNRRSAEVARAAKDMNGELHARDYMVYAYLQSGRDEAARQAITEAQQIAGAESPSAAGPFALAAMPARFAMERGAWEEAAALTPQPTKFAFADATTHFARAVGLARSGKPEAAADDIKALQRLADALRASNAYWAEQVDIQYMAAMAWIADAEGRRDEALALMRRAAEIEAGTEKHVITPGPLAPAREQLAEMLLAADRPADALEEFEAVQQVEPNRFRALAGAGRAAELAGDLAAAKRYYGQVVEITASADSARPEIEAARAFVAAN
jgi:tetratricopeptide (TPR) repeat protein